MFVITADQDASRRVGDRVDTILAHLQQVGPPQGKVLGFERTAGDKSQADLYTDRPCQPAAMELQRQEQWAVGIGIGTAELAASARASAGPAFLHARAAVERASSKAVPVPLALQASFESDPGLVAEAEALLQLLSAVVRRRSAAGWEAADQLASGARTHREVGESLGISPQAVGQRLRVAMWAEEQATRPLAVRLLRCLDEQEEA